MAAPVACVSNPGDRPIHQDVRRPGSIRRRRDAQDSECLRASGGTGHSPLPCGCSWSHGWYAAKTRGMRRRTRLRCLGEAPPSRCRPRRDRRCSLFATPRRDNHHRRSPPFPPSNRPHDTAGTPLAEAMLQDRAGRLPTSLRGDTTPAVSQYPRRSRRPLSLRPLSTS